MEDFVDKLRTYLDRYKYRYVTTETYGGCETCGYGGDEVEHVDGEALMREIDEFCKSFQK